MKVGLLTLHYAHNYGAMLQAYALKKVMQDMGVDVEFVNYQSRTDNQIYPEPQRPGIKQLQNPKKYALMQIRYIMEKRYNQFNLKTWDLFDSFLKNELNANSPVIQHPFELVNSDFDAFVCGSDQIWNPDIVKGLRREYFADINHKARRIAYAASVGDLKAVTRNTVFFENSINKMDFVSVREDDLQKYIQEQLNVKATLVLDPTLLLSKDAYSKIITTPDIIDPYVLIYNIKGRENEVSRFGKNIAKKQRKMALEISGKLISPSTRGYRRIKSSGPAEFLGWIKNADTIVTDSFHGVALSIVFEKNFYYIPQGRTQRVISLLTLLGLNDRIINDDYIANNSRIDYTEVRKKLDTYKKSSIEFLHNALYASLPETQKAQTYLKSLKQKDCYGCGACKVVCPENAIDMVPDDKGFLYPQVDQSICIHCSLCETTCPLGSANGIYPVRNNLPTAFAVKHTSDLVRKQSASGGVFTAISDFVLDSGGVVFGAIFDDQMRIVHSMATTKNERDKQRKSKYVQSDAFEIFPLVKAKLIEGKNVLFTGTSCQVSALQNYLKIDYDNLYTCDLSCVGISSPLIFKGYQEYLEKRNKSKINSLDFRYKDKTSEKFNGKTPVSVSFKNGKQIVRKPDSFSFGRLQNSFVSLRPACFRCEYASPIRPADITIGNFQGNNNWDKSFNDGKGVSTLLVQTEKGQRLLDAISDGVLNIKKVDLKFTIGTGLDATRYIKISYDGFWNDFKSMGYSFVAKKYGDCSWKAYLKYYLKSLKRVNNAKK